MASLGTTLRTDMVSQINTTVGTTGHVIVYTGSAPSKTSAPTGSTLATWALSNPAGAAATGVWTMTVPSSVTAAYSGTPGYGRIIDGATDDGTHTNVQFSCGIGSGELSFNAALSSGGAASIIAFTITDGNP